MTEPGNGHKLGVVLTDERALSSARATDPVDYVVLRSTLLNPPRDGAARRLADRVRAKHPDAAIVPYAWHLVTHGVDDGLRKLGTRSLPGEASAFGRLQATPEVEAAWATTLQCAEALGARHVLIRTPAGLTPGPVGQARLRAFFQRAHERGLDLIWEAEGLWEDDETQKLAKRYKLASLIPGFDAIGRAFRGSLEHRWLRVDSAGATERLRPALAEELYYSTSDALAEAGSPGPATVLFTGHRNYANLRAFSQQARKLASEL